MKAAIYYGPKDIRLEERPIPVPGSSDVVIKVKRAGICGSDLTAYLHDGRAVGILKNGEEEGRDGQFGHEMVGVVESVGEAVKDVKKGDRVFINPTTCRRDGMMSCDMAGAFSEYALVEDAAYGYNLFKLQDDVSFDEAVVIEPFSVGTHGKNCIQAQAYEHAVVFGAGAIGLSALNALLAIGCTRPVIVDMNAERLKIAEEMGGTPYLYKSDSDLKEFLFQHFGTVLSMFGMPCVDVDVFIDCAGAGTVLSDILKMAKKGARIAVVAVYKKTIDFNPAEFMHSELIMKGSLGYEQKDILEAYQNVNNRRTQISKMVTHHFPHEKVVEAFKFAADPASGSIKVVIDYD